MASTELTGTSVAGYQMLVRVPATYRRFFLEVVGQSYNVPVLKGQFLLSYAAIATDPVRSVFEARPVWGNGVVVVVPYRVTSNAARIWELAVQWRKGGYSWYVYADDAALS